MRSRPARSSKLIILFMVMALLAAACTSSDNSATNDPDNDDVASSGESGDDAPADQDESNGQTDGDDAAPAASSFAAPDPDLSRIEISDDVRSGVLDNGLTYFVQSNDSPGGSVSLRLAVKAGGLHEDPIGTGVAHFLEHMMFNGTEQFPGATLDATLRSIGAEIGPDFNAFTADTQTVYQLQVADQGNNVSIAFDVLAQWASAALIEPDEVDAERPVVREELRLRDESGDGIVGEAFNLAYFQDTPFEGVSVSGTAETVNAITPEDLRTFYDTWYRPDNIAIVAVGDQSLDDLEQQIIDRFEAMEPRGEIVEPPVVGDFDLRTEPLVEAVVEPTFADSFVSVDIPIRSWDLSTVGGNELLLTEIALGIAIDNRLTEGVASGRLDLRRGGGGWFPRNGDLAYIGFNFDADDLVAGTEVFMTELQGSLQNPFSQDEIDRAVDSILSFEEQRLAQFETTQDDDFADEIVRYFVDGNEIAFVEDSVERNLDFLESLSADEANNHWGWLLSSSAPILLAVGPDAERVGDPADHLAAVEAASQAIVDVVDDEIDEIDVLIEAPDSVDEVESNDLDNGDRELVFANGHRVLFADSSISEGQISLVSESPGGRAVLSDDDGALASAALDVVSASGLAEWSPTQIRRHLATIDADVTPVISDFTEGFSGRAATTDAETMFQLLHLLVTQPRVDQVPFDQQIERNRDLIDLLDFDSATAASVAATNARTGGGNFAGAPTDAQIDSLSQSEAERIYSDRFASLDDHTIVVVGDIDEDDVVDLARTWIGTLPPADGADSPGGYPELADVSERLAVGSGTSGGSYIFVATGTREPTVENQVLAEITSRLVNDRIFTVIREELGASYGGFSFSRFVDPGSDVDLVINIDGDPSRIDEIADTVDDELAAIAAGETSAEDFNEAFSVLDAEYDFINNPFIIESLFDEASGGDGPLLSRLSQRQALESIGPNDVAAFVEDLLASGQQVDIRNVPR